jgi:hypothetical protein
MLRGASMSVLRSSQRSLGSALGVGVALSVAACVSGEGTNNGDDGGGAGLSTAARAGHAVGGAAGRGGATTGGIGGTTGGVGGAMGGSAGAALTTGGSGGASGGGGGFSAGASGTGPSGGSGGACEDTPPPNGNTCADAVGFGWCGQPWMNGACARSCDLCSGSSGGTGGTSTAGRGGTGGAGGSGGGSSGTSGGNVEPPPAINGGSQAWASRYWDCCKPACGWSGNVSSGSPMTACDQQNQDLSSYDTKNACESGGSAYMCWDGAPWQVGDKLSYGFVAASGPNYVCGRCFHVQFNGSGHSGNNAGAMALNGKHMIVQVINNGGVAQDQFDLLIPGGGVGLLNACNTQWGTSDLGAQYGGFLTGCNGDQSCVRDKCNAIFGDKPGLMAGCEWFLGWYQAADNPNLTYERIACPSALTQRSGLSDPG